MKRGTLMVLLFCLFLPLAELWNSSQDVKIVNVVGLFGSGVVLGSALAYIFFSLKVGQKP